MPTVLITGASSGIGEATARLFLERGWRVFGAARRVSRMSGLQAEGADVRHLDLCDEDSITSLVSEIVNREGGIDALINNAGFGVFGAVEDVSLEDARRQFEVNLFGLARLTQLVLPGMRERQSGTIVNVSSMGGKVYTPLGAWYHASKHALEGWSDCLRLETEPFGVRVILVEPGAIQTEFEEIAIDPMLRRSGGGSYGGVARKMADATRQTYSSGRATPPSHIARVIVRAVESRRPKTRYLTGHLACAVVLARRILGDRIYDRLVRRFL